MTSVTQTGDRRDALFIADFHPRLGAWLGRQHAGGYDAEAGRSRFLAWLAAHTDDGDAPAIRRLTAEEEAELATRIQAGRRAEETLAQHAGELAPEARAELEQSARDGLVAGRRLLEANRLLVVSLAARYADRGVPYSELVQEGNRGLLTAVYRYDHTRGYRFATFATWWIRHEIAQATTGRARAVTSVTRAVMAARREEAKRRAAERPAGVRQSLDELTRTEHRMLRALGREPTPEELAAELDRYPRPSRPSTDSCEEPI
jgi:RNA polymerase primary sigma factor